MNSLTKNLLAAVAVIAVVGVVFFLRSKESLRITAPVGGDKYTATEAVKIERPLATHTSSNAAASTAAGLDEAQFAKRFGLSSTESGKLRAAMGSIWRDLIEIKGQSAKVESYDGKQLVLTVPGLGLSVDELEKFIVAKLSEKLGEEKTIAILADDVGQKSIFDFMSYSQLVGSARYRFDRVKDPGASQGLAFSNGALFNVAWDSQGVDPVTKATTMAHREWNGWSFAFTYGINLGWNAMAKAPEGYFRPEPIAGVQSRSKGLPSVIHDVDTGAVEFNGALPARTQAGDGPKS